MEIAFVVFIVCVFVIVQLFRMAGSGTFGALNATLNPAGEHDRLAAQGLPAIGILLSVGRNSVGTVGTGPRYFQQRNVTLDVEIPGQAPYQLSIIANIPTNIVRDVLPGATLELRVDRKNAQRIAVIGPGIGFAAAALNFGMLTTNQQPGRSR